MSACTVRVGSLSRLMIWGSSCSYSKDAIWLSGTVLPVTITDVGGFSLFGALAQHDAAPSLASLGA